MGDDKIRIDRALAEWVLGRLTPVEAQQLAVRALEDGCASRAMAIIAGLDTDSRFDIDDELPRLLHELGKQRPTTAEALKILVDDCARQIAVGEIDPVAGGWMMWDYSTDDDESPEFFQQVARFVGLASECDNPGPHVLVHRAELVAEAIAFLDRGGLQLRSGPQ